VLLRNVSVECGSWGAMEAEAKTGVPTQAIPKPTKKPRSEATAHVVEIVVGARTALGHRQAGRRRRDREGPASEDSNIGEGAVAVAALPACVRSYILECTQNIEVVDGLGKTAPASPLAHKDRRDLVRWPLSSSSQVTISKCVLSWGN